MQWLSGRKTYILAGFLILKAALTVAGILPGEPTDALREALEGLGLATLRAGVTKSHRLRP